MLLNILLSLPIFGCFLVGFIPYTYFRQMRIFGFFVTNLIYLLTLSIWVFLFDSSRGSFQIFYVFYFKTKHNVCWSMALDGISMPFLILTSFIFVFCFLSSWKKTRNLRIYMICLLFLEFTILGAFLTNDLLFFYFFFESTLIPMFFMIGFWGSGFNRLVAANYFFFYTAVGSVFFYFCIVAIYLNIGGTSILLLQHHVFANPFLENMLFLGFFFAFAMKLPMFPIHTWLPEAHVQAPTEGSVILASLLLKLGGYGILRILLGPFKNSIDLFFPLISVCAFCGVVYCGMSAIVQVDMKKLIAYASVSHMNLILVGLLSNNIFGVQGAIFMMLGHGVVASVLFFLIGFFYDRHKSRNLLYYGGIVIPMPLFSTFLFVALLANTSMPLTCNFIGEFLIFIGIFEKSLFLGIILIFSSVIGVGYSFFFFNSFIFLNLKQNYTARFKDIVRIEYHTLIYLIIAIVVFGIFPNKILFISEMSVRCLVLLHM